MRTIPLTRGFVALVDDEDYDVLSRYRWHARPTKRSAYAARTEHHGLCGDRFFLMHQQILGIDDGRKCDHIDGNGLNNQRSNLRPATNQQNAWNVGLRASNTSGYVGVSFAKEVQKWRATIRIDGRNTVLGYFSDPIEAAYEYDAAAVHYRGEFARLNFPLSGEQAVTVTAKEVRRSS